MADIPNPPADSADSAINNLLSASLGVLEVRRQSAGRKVVDQQAYNELQAIKRSLYPLARMHMLNGEARGAAAFDSLLYMRADCIGDVIPDNVVRVEREFALGRKRVDRAIFHADGRLTLVEVKDFCDERMIVAGIGQALYYAALAERLCDAAPIVPALAVLGERDSDVARACQRGGVEYIPLGSVKMLRLLSQLTHGVMFDGP